MTQCRVCGRDFDPLRFQLVVPGLGGFDSVECAEQARSHLGPASAPAPVAAVVSPFPAAAAAAAAPLAAAAGEPGQPLLVGANLALLAAGTAATLFLWFRVFGADPSPLDLSGAGLAGAPAFERSTVPAQISASRRSPTRPSEPAPEATVVSSPPATAATPPATGGGGTLVDAAPAPPQTSVPRPAFGGNAAENSSTRPSRPSTSAEDDGEDEHGNAHSTPQDKARGHDKDDHEHVSGGSHDGEHGKSNGGHSKGHSEHGGHGKGHGKHD
jgi:hypothetical protein